MNGDPFLSAAADDKRGVTGGAAGGGGRENVAVKTRRACQAAEIIYQWYDL